MGFLKYLERTPSMAWVCLAIFASTAFFLPNSSLLAQDRNAEYFSENKYADYPIITFRENLFNQPVYYVNGVKANAGEVRAYLEIQPGDAQDFAADNSKRVGGAALRYVGLAVTTGSLVYLFTNQLQPNNFSTFFWVSFGGGIVGSIGASMEANAKRRIAGTIDKYNYIISRDQLQGHYLTMDVRDNLLGEKIDIYDGPNLLNKAQIRSLMENRPDMYADYLKALRKQNLSFALDIGSLALDLVFVAYFISPQLQSSTPNDILIPLVFTNLGLGIISGQVRRSARNLTRSALYRYNFGDAVTPSVPMQQSPVAVANFVSFGIPLDRRK
ncbi:hypothetical protein [Mariniradius saccharolyticus]|uniref:hypothetical protein n=1 Tax=Mariniradius saccharolyticus TaxID=1245591 RepID=UPI0006856005|nr:hypothetical protein [Mariniradius saccharolyticus]